MASSTEIRAAIVDIEGAFAKSLTDQQVDVWCEHLKDITAERLAKGVEALIRRERHFPKVATVRKYAGEVDVPGPRHDTAVSTERHGIPYAGGAWEKTRWLNAEARAYMRELGMDDIDAPDILRLTRARFGPGAPEHAPDDVPVDAAVDFGIEPGYTEHANDFFDNTERKDVWG